MALLPRSPAASWLKASYSRARASDSYFVDPQAKRSCPGPGPLRGHQLSKSTAVSMTGGLVPGPQALREAAAYYAGMRICCTVRAFLQSPPSWIFGE